MLFDKLIKEGKYLFKFRGQFPLLLIALAIPSVWFNPIKIKEELLNCLLVSAIFISTLGFFVRFMTIGYRSKFSSGRNRSHHHTEKLDILGWYSVTRNPLYFGNYLIWLGISLYVGNPFFSIILSLFYWIYVERIIASEEEYLKITFDEHYVEYAKKTNVFFPNFKNWKKSYNAFSLKIVLKNEYPGLSAAVLCYWFVFFLNRSFLFNSIELTVSDLILVLCVLFFAFMMKLLKKYTKLFNEFD